MSKLTWAACLAVQAVVWVLAADGRGQEQQFDPKFDTSVANPTYKDQAPRVLFDEAHHNFHRSDGRYKPFAELIRNDGYAITPGNQPFSAESLKEFSVLVIANALGAAEMGTADAANPAFKPAECSAVVEWIKGGGALFLITDHYPTGMAADSLGEALGVKMSGGMTDEYDFAADSGLAAAHPILRGRSEAEVVRRVRTFTGQSIQGPAAAMPLLTLPQGAKEMHPDPTDHFRGKPIEGMAKFPSQLVAFTLGKGRVVVSGEAAMFTAQARGSDRFGMNQTDVDNRQLALNIMHWLSGLLPEA